DHRLRRPIDDHAALQGGGHDRRRVAIQVEPPHESGAAHLLHDSVLRRHGPQPVLEMTADAAHVGDHSAVAQHVHHATHPPAVVRLAAFASAAGSFTGTKVTPASSGANGAR